MEDTQKATNSSWWSRHATHLGIAAMCLFLGALATFTAMGTEVERALDHIEYLQRTNATEVPDLRQIPGTLRCPLGEKHFVWARNGHQCMLAAHAFINRQAAKHRATLAIVQEELGGIRDELDALRASCGSAKSGNQRTAWTESER